MSKSERYYSLKSKGIALDAVKKRLLTEEHIVMLVKRSYRTDANNELKSLVCARLATEN